MSSELKQQQGVWIVISALSLIASITGVVNISVYDRLIGSDLLPAVFAPDVLTILCSFVLFTIAIRLRPNQFKARVVGLGILGYFFYNYGIYVIERVYNPLYFIYLAIFTLSFWSIVASVFMLTKLKFSAHLPNRTRWLSLILSVLQPLMFYPLWILQLLPLIEARNKIEFLYSVYILDLCLIMPAFLLLSIQLYKKTSLGLLLTPVIFILGFIEIFSLALADLIKPYFHANPGTGSWLPATLLSGTFLFMAFTHLKQLNIEAHQHD